MTDVREFLKFLKYVDKSKLWLIPLGSNSKRPIKGFNWTDQRISIKQAIDWLKQGNNVAVVAKANGLCFIDVDNPDLVRHLKIPPTLTVRTPHGGYHYYFYNCGITDNWFGLVEYRMHNAYVVAPGSEIDGKVYRIVYACKPKMTFNPLFIEGYTRTRFMVIGGI